MRYPGGASRKIISKTIKKCREERVITKLATALGITEGELLIELKTTNGNGGGSIGAGYIEKLKLAESLKSEEAVTLISSVIDFCLENDKKNAKLEAIKGFIKGHHGYITFSKTNSQSVWAKSE